MPLDGPAPDPDDINAVGAEEEQEEGKAKKKGLSKIIIYASVGIVMVVAGYFGATKFLGSADKSGDAETAEAEGQKEAPMITEMIEFEDVIVNPAGTGGTRFLAASIGFEISGANTSELFESKKLMVRDALISILGSKTIEQLSNAKEKEITRFQIKKRIEHLLKTEELKAVYFTNFVLQ